MLWFALQLSFMFVIYSHTDRIGTWSKWQVVLLLGASHFIQQIFTAIFLTNCTQLSELIRSRQTRFHPPAARQHALHDLVPASGSGRFRQRRLCGRGDDLRGQSARIVADLGAGGRVCPAGCGEVFWFTIR